MDKHAEIQKSLETVAMCICDLEELAKCNSAVVTADAKAMTKSTFHVLSERISSNLMKIEQLLES